MLLKKDAARRYPSAAALAEDLQRFLAGRPIQARSASGMGTRPEVVARRPAQAALAAVAVIVVIGTAGGMAWSQHLAPHPTVRLQHEIDRADRQAEEADGNVGSRWSERPWPIGTSMPPRCDWPTRHATWDSSSAPRRSSPMMSTGPAPGIVTLPGDTSGGSSRREVALLGETRRFSVASPCPRTVARWHRATRRAASSSGTRPSSRSRATLSGHRGRRRLARVLARQSVWPHAERSSPRQPGMKEIRLWDVAEGRLRSRPVGELADEVRVMTFMDDGRLLALVTRDPRAPRPSGSGTWRPIFAATAKVRRRGFWIRHGLARRAVLRGPRV